MDPTCHFEDLELKSRVHRQLHCFDQLLPDFLGFLLVLVQFRKRVGLLLYEILVDLQDAAEGIVVRLEGFTCVVVALSFSFQLVCQIMIDGVVDDPENIGILVNDSEYLVPRGQNKGRLGKRNLYKPGLSKSEEQQLLAIAEVADILEPADVVEFPVLQP